MQACSALVLCHSEVQYLVLFSMLNPETVSMWLGWWWFHVKSEIWNATNENIYWIFAPWNITLWSKLFSILFWWDLQSRFLYWLFTVWANGGKKCCSDNRPSLWQGNSVYSAVTHLLHQMQHQQSFRSVSSNLAIVDEGFQKAFLYLWTFVQGMNVVVTGLMISHCADYK